MQQGIAIILPFQRFLLLKTLEMPLLESREKYHLLSSPKG
jgi:hypothetical protein